MSEVLVLCYHAVSPSWMASLSVTPEALERQLRSLLRDGWRSASFRDAVLSPSTPRTLAVTFDDAFASVKELALPVLESLDMSATAFVPTAYVSGERLSWDGIEHWRATPHAGELTPMSWDDLGALADRGWEIGSHTQTHPHLTQVDDERLRAELEGSRDECMRHLGRSCDTIAYPYGDVDERVVAGARMAGYVAGASLSRWLRPLGPHRWPRVGIYSADAAWRFRLKVARPSRALRAS